MPKLATQGIVGQKKAVLGRRAKPEGLESGQPSPPTLAPQLKPPRIALHYVRFADFIAPKTKHR